jgi:long-chain acyl-CoA synthetase
VSEAVVIGDRRKYLVALLALDLEALARFGAERHLGSGPLTEHPEVLRSLQKAVDEVNETLARVETVKKFKVLPQPFSMEAGELTPTLKLKRKVVYRNYAAEIEELYKE